MALYISSMMPDRALEDSVVAKAIIKVARELAALRNHPAQQRSPTVDIVYMLPGVHEQADFLGLRLRAYDQESLIARFEAAVPANMLQSERAEEYVHAVILDAIDAAAEFFTEQKVLFNANEHMQMFTPVQEVQATLH
ncbi:MULTISPECIES: hypothetical protein [Methylomonas]|uniref:hypothetical protein n=1 Tax=Methylomonas TaxID=416 RepID=UPI001E3894A7|nr:hypothetical protein [Methylomonas rhizoryzae]